MAREVARTQRLRLREFCADDLPAIVRWCSDPDVMRYIGRGGALATSQCERILELYIEGYRTRGYAMWAVTELGFDSALGWCGLQPLETSGLTEVGWLLERDAQGRGFATEAARASLGYGFGNLALDRIVAVAFPENLPSRAVMCRLGMHERGLRRYYDNDLMFAEISAAEFGRIAGND